MERILAVAAAIGSTALGIQALLEATQVPKGSFYHHFRDKEDFALQVLDQYMRDVHAGHDACLAETTLPPLERVRCFFDMTGEAYREQGSMGCLLGGLGQALSSVHAVLRHTIARRFAALAAPFAQRPGTRPFAAVRPDRAGAASDCATEFGGPPSTRWPA